MTDVRETRTKKLARETCIFLEITNGHYDIKITSNLTFNITTRKGSNVLHYRMRPKLSP